MEYRYILTGLAIAIVSVVLFMVFRPEFSMISGDNIDNTRIIGIGTNGDIYLSDNTIKSMNTFIDDIKTSVTTLKTELNAKIDATKAGLIKNEIASAKSGAISTAKTTAENLINSGNFISHQDHIRITSSRNRCLFNAGDDNNEKAKFGDQQCRTQKNKGSQEGILLIGKIK